MDVRDHYFPTLSQVESDNKNFWTHTHLTTTFELQISNITKIFFLSITLNHSFLNHMYAFAMGAMISIQTNIKFQINIICIVMKPISSDIFNIINSRPFIDTLPVMLYPLFFSCTSVHVRSLIHFVILFLYSTPSICHHFHFHTTQPVPHMMHRHAIYRSYTLSILSVKDTNCSKCSAVIMSHFLQNLHNRCPIARP